jgi:hypothetical protein
MTRQESSGSFSFKHIMFLPLIIQVWHPPSSQSTVHLQPAAKSSEKITIAVERF